MFNSRHLFQLLCTLFIQKCYWKIYFLSLNKYLFRSHEFTFKFPLSLLIAFYWEENGCTPNIFLIIQCYLSCNLLLVFTTTSICSSFLFVQHIALQNKFTYILFITISLLFQMFTQVWTISNLHLIYLVYLIVGGNINRSNILWTEHWFWEQSFSLFNLCG